MDDGAWIHQPQADTAVDRGGHPGELQLQLGGIDRRLVRLSRRRERGDLGLQRIDVLAGRSPHTRELREASQIYPGVCELGQVLREIRLGQLQLCLEWARIDLSKEVAFVYVAALCEADSVELRVDSDLGGHGIEGRDRPEPREPDRQIASRDGTDGHRYRGRVRAGRGGGIEPIAHGIQVDRKADRQEQQG